MLSGQSGSGRERDRDYLSGYQKCKKNQKREEREKKALINFSSRKLALVATIEALGKLGRRRR